MLLRPLLPCDIACVHIFCLYIYIYLYIYICFAGAGQVQQSEQVRRIQLSRLWDTEASAVSYKTLSDLALHYFNSTGTRDGLAVTITITYLDEDGDSITISTDEELADAFWQFADKEPPVLRATATISALGDFDVGSAAVAAAGGDKKSADTRSDSAENEEEPKATITNTKTEEKPNKATPEPQPVPVEAIVRGVASILSSVVSSFRLQHASNTTSPHTTATSTPTTAASTAAAATASMSACTAGTEEAERLVREVISNIHQADGSPPAATANGAGTTTTIAGKEFDPTFVHGFHTCDGCLTKPIVGIRHHAINKPDYDLCKTCHDTRETWVPRHAGYTLFEPQELGKCCFYMLGAHANILHA